MYRAVIFDLDGTILNTIEDLQTAMNHMLRDFGFPERELDYHKKSVGSGVRRYVQNCLPHCHRDDDALISRCVETMNRYYTGNWNKKTRPYDGILDCMKQMLSCGMKLNVLSNKIHPATNAMVQTFFSEIPFSFIWGEREGVPRKPNPTAALEMASRLSIPPDKFLFIGDSSFDMLTAKNAGMYAVGAAWGYQPREMLEETGADFIADSPKDLCRLIG